MNGLLVSGLTSVVTVGISLFVAVIIRLVVAVLEKTT
jgi:hypothetical protein